MPAGPGPIGFLAFSGVKFLGYTAAAVVLQRAYQSTRNPWVVGLGRTGIGLVAGALFGGVWILVSSHFENKWPDWLAALCFFGPLIPIRLGEWGLLIHWFFDRGLRQREKSREVRHDWEPMVVCAGRRRYRCGVRSSRWILDLLRQT